MSAVDDLSGPWVFEPHRGYGGEIDGEAMPFGYISTSNPRLPIFELDTPLAFPPAELVACALKMAAAHDLYEALKKARSTINALYVGLAMSDEGRAINLAYIDAALSLTIDGGRNG